MKREELRRGPRPADGEGVHHEKNLLGSNRQAREALKVRYQAETRGDAENNYHRWTQEEDAVVLSSELTDVEIALELGRSWRAVVSRRERLWVAESMGGTPSYDSGGNRVGALQRNRDKGLELCPCGSTDDTHDSWCPQG